MTEQVEVQEFTLTGTGWIELSGTGRLVKDPDGVIRACMRSSRRRRWRGDH